MENDKWRKQTICHCATDIGIQKIFKMFRWLKNGKNKEKTAKQKSAGDNYGFHNQSNSNYGFQGSKSPENLDSSVHIYDEISEVAEISFSRQFTLLPEKTNMGNNVEGPYLVVPILPSRRTSSKRDADQEDQTDFNEKSSMKNERKQRVYSAPWDKPRSGQGEKHKNSLIHPAFRDSDSGYTCNSVSTRTDSDRVNDSDTGCEYDMSISTESDVSSEYKELISKIQNNLTLKHQILDMIKESETGESGKIKSSAKITSSSSLDSCDFIRSRDTFDRDETESEYSSGFEEYELDEHLSCEIPSAQAKNRKSKFHRNVSAASSESGKSTSEPSVSNSETSYKLQTNSLKEQYGIPKRTCNLQSKSSTSIDSSNNKNSDIYGKSSRSKRNSLQSAASLAPSPTNIYQKSNNTRYSSSNRMLGDLINMNHNMQTMKF
ncbi:unnamed protein product [Mytilus edulis]|uniref:Uncharacterized protein n=1 Tax=Mytilus edulis TaxID=6550 RepID=A0A8S3QKY9_MYTED|nr:unnamed protein product [Mytilus edulis]